MVISVYDVFRKFLPAVTKTEQKSFLGIDKYFQFRSARNFYIKSTLFKIKPQKDLIITANKYINFH